MVSEKKIDVNRTSQDWRRIYLFTKNMFWSSLLVCRIHTYSYICSIYILYCKCCFYLHMYIHIYVNVPVLVWSISGPEFGRKVPAMEYHKKAKLCLWKRNFFGLLIGDWDKRKRKERERERKSKTQKNIFFSFLRVPPPPKSSQVITSLYLRLGSGGGHAEKKIFFFSWVLDFGFSLSRSLSFCLFL